MKKTAKKKAAEPRPLGLDAALDAARRHLGSKPLFVPSSRRYVPMRHRALARLLGGEVHPGLPTGCFIETRGKEHSGKTTFATACADAVINQPEGVHVLYDEHGRREIPAPRRVAIIDFEHTYDLAYACGAVRNAVPAAVHPRTGKILNAKEANLFVHRPDTLEEGVDLLLSLIESGEFGLGVMDSVAAMLSEAERGVSMRENTVGLLPRAVGKMLRKSTHLLSRYGTTVVLVNQWRDKIGVPFGDPRTAPGGKALNFYDSILLDLSGPPRTPWFEHGRVANIRCMKNKVTGKLGTVTYHIGAGVGLSAEAELLEALIATGHARHARGRVTLHRRPGDKNPAAAWGSPAEFFAELRRPGKRLFEQLWARVERHEAATGTAARAAAPRGWGMDDE